MDKQRVLIFDIETSDMVVSTFGMRDQYINDDQVIQDIRVLCCGAKWLGDPQSSAMYKEARRPHHEKGLLQWIVDLLNQADIVITHNGKSFDCKVIAARCIFHRINPPSPYRHLDTYLIARGVARFSSNKLSYLSKLLSPDLQKSTHPNFPGRSLWRECAAGNPKAWAEMHRYNLRDVFATEAAYDRIRAWAPANAPAIYPASESVHCGVCGSARMHRHGYERLKTGLRIKRQCDDCGRWQQGEKVKEKMTVKVLR